MQKFGGFDSVWMHADGGHFEHLHWIQNSRTSLISILLLHKKSSYDFRVIFFMSKYVYIFLGHPVYTHIHTYIHTHTHTPKYIACVDRTNKIGCGLQQMYVNCNLKHKHHNYLLYLAYTLHKVYVVTCNYANNLSIIHSSKQSLSLFQDLPCTSYLLDPITTTSLPATENLHCIQI